MSDFDEQIADFRSQAAGLIENYSQTERDVSRDGNLTDEGKAAELGPLHEDMQSRVRALMDAEKAAVKGLRETAERALYGIPPHATSAELVSYRDAQDRAARLAGQMDAWAKDDAKTAYDSAVRSGDKVLAAAIFGAAVERGWPEIQDDHITRNPSAKPHLKNLELARRHENNAFGRALAYSAPSINTRGTYMAPHLDGMKDTPTTDDAEWARNFFGGKK